jgi:hypothetical protein
MANETFDELFQEITDNTVTITKGTPDEEDDYITTSGDGNSEEEEASSSPKLKEFYQHLHDTNAWVSAKDAAEALDMDERSIRRLSNESKGHIFSGPDGYRATNLAAKDEIREIETWKKEAISLMERYKEAKDVYRTKREFSEDFK